MSHFEMSAQKHIVLKLISIIFVILKFIKFYQFFNHFYYFVKYRFYFIKNYHSINLILEEQSKDLLISN